MRVVRCERVVDTTENFDKNEERNAGCGRTRVWTDRRLKHATRRAQFLRRAVGAQERRQRYQRPMSRLHGCFTTRVRTLPDTANALERQMKQYNWFICHSESLAALNSPTFHLALTLTRVSFCFCLACDEKQRWSDADARRQMEDGHAGCYRVLFFATTLSELSRNLSISLSLPPIVEYILILFEAQTKCNLMHL